MLDPVQLWEFENGLLTLSSDTRYDKQKFWADEDNNKYCLWQ